MNIWNTPRKHSESSNANQNRATPSTTFSRKSSMERVEPKAEKVPDNALSLDGVEKEEELRSRESSELVHDEPEDVSNDRPEEQEEQPTVRRYKVLKRRQRRRQSLSVSVSEEEEDILREAASKANKSFSSWAREALFKAARRKPPKRPT